MRAGPPAAGTTPDVPVRRAAGPVVVGAGLAGLLTAARVDGPCTVLSPWPLAEQTSTAWAQGGLAAAVGPDDDPALHAADTLAAGAGLCDPDVVTAVTAAAPAAVTELERLGARLDRRADGSLDLGLEGAHGRRRIVHAGGDASGAELERVAIAAVRARGDVPAGVDVLVGRRALDVLVDDHGVTGLLCTGPDGLYAIATRQVVLATGGLGGLYTHTTNPLGSRGQGVALAARAGAVVRDIELVQFHPTALAAGVDPHHESMPLVSEAVRGEGAVLVLADGSPALPDPLAARDVVARGLWAHLSAGRAVYLDARDALGDSFAHHFPTIAARCRAAGIDPARDLVPVRPAAHYSMGGILVDHAGRTTVPGLWAVGECASTGLHGANRLASNSLLEAVVCSAAVADDLAGAQSGPVPDPAGAAAAALRRHRPGRHHPHDVRSRLEHAAGVLRDGPGLTNALAVLAPHADTDDDALVAALICRGALLRRESRGAHTRTDHPGTGRPAHTHQTIDDIRSLADAATLLERTAS